MSAPFILNILDLILITTTTNKNYSTENKIDLQIVECSRIVQAAKSSSCIRKCLSGGEIRVIYLLAPLPLP
jgi:hypothetical protein